MSPLGFRSQKDSKTGSECLPSRARCVGFARRFFPLAALVFFLGAALHPKPSLAQKPSFLSSANLERLAELDFDSLNTKDGLPHQSVYSFTQDSAGFVWIATYGGLSRFDGYLLRSYTHDPANAASLPDNNVRVLLPGPDGDLWIGSDAGGVFYYRASSDSFEALPNAPAPLRGLRVYCLISDGDGGIWAGGQFGLFHFNPKTGIYETYTSTEDPLELTTSSTDSSDLTARSAFTLKRVFSLFLDKDKTLWVGGDPGVIRRKAGQTRFEPVLGIAGEHEVGPRPFVWSFLQDHAGKIWVGCDHVGIATYDPAANLLRGVPGLSGAISELGEHTVRGLIEYDPGQIWMATYGGGLVTYDSSDGFIRSFVKTSGSPSPLHNNFMRGIFKDRSGVVWMGTDNGLSKINDTAEGIYQIHPALNHPGKLAGTDVRSVGVVNGTVWVGFDQGEFGPLDPDAHVTRIEPAPGVPSSQVTRREILAIRDTDPNTVYIGGTGLFRVDLKTRTYRPSADPLVNGEIVSSLFQDCNTLWAGTYNGLYSLDLKTGQSHMYRHNPADPTSLSENDVRGLLRDREGHLWISTRAGLDVRDPITGHFRSFRHVPGNPATLPGDNVRAMVEDKQDRLWIATTGNGLAILDHWTADNNPVFRTLDTTNGLLSNSVLTVTLGTDGRVWANTAEGLSVIDPKTFAVQTYTAGDGLRSTSQKLFGSVTLDDGTLIFRSVDGLIAVQPTHLVQRSYKAPLVLTSFDTLGRRPSPLSNAWQAMHQGIELSPYHRSFRATFALLDYTGSDTTLFSYTLSGVDKSWTQLPPRSHSAVITDLPAGTYHLRVRAISRSGQGPVIESEYTVTAPRLWTETITFRIALILMGLTLIYILIRVRTRVLEARRAHLEEVIAQRTMELKEQSRKLGEANIKLGELAIRDPLTELFNRRHFVEVAEAEYLRSRRSRRTFSILLMDIDHFKIVNDTWGHLTGDAVLQMVAERIQGSLRATDTAARFGGEEFIVLLPETSSAHAVQLADRICDAIAASPFKTTANDIVTTLSVGCAEFDRTQTLTQILERADKALYLAKAGGRNRTACA